MLHQNIFNKEKEVEDIVKKTFLTLLDFNKDYNSIVKVDNLEEISSDTRHVLPPNGAVEIASVMSSSTSKNVFLINEAFNEHIRNINTAVQNNFYKLYYGLHNIIPEFLNNKEKDINLSILNIVSPRLDTEDVIVQSVYREGLDIANDVALLRTLGSINIFVPSDAREVEYLLKISEKRFFKNSKNNISYFKLTGAPCPKIFNDNYFEKDGNLKEWTGIPEIIYLSKNIDSSTGILMIVSGPILYNALIAAKELENINYKVTVVNMSLINSSSEYINQKIKSFILHLTESNKNIITIEEHSKTGGMGSLISEILSNSRNYGGVRLERMGLEDDLSPRNIIAKSEEVVGF